MMFTCIFCSFMQAALQPAVREKWCYLVQHREDFHELGVQDVAGFDSDLCSVFFRRRMKRKEKWSRFLFPGTELDMPCWDFCGC
jgi:hypothetical protein